jgi:hypothetical protein
MLIKFVIDIYICINILNNSIKKTNEGQFIIQKLFLSLSLQLSFKNYFYLYLYNYHSKHFNDTTTTKYYMHTNKIKLLIKFRLGYFYEQTISKHTFFTVNIYNEDKPQNKNNKIWKIDFTVIYHLTFINNHH